jgi:hypothetical protein
MDKHFYEISDKQIEAIQNAVLQFHNIIVSIRRDLEIPDEGFVPNNSENIKENIFNGGLLFKHILLGDDAKEDYKEFLSEIYSSIGNIKISILKNVEIKESLLDKILFAYIFYNKFFIFEIKIFNKQVNKIESKKFVLSFDAKITIEEFKEFVLKDNLHKYSEQEIEEYYIYSTKIVDSIYHIWQK